MGNTVYFPNPANQQLFVAVTNAERHSVVITDVMGKTMNKQQSEKGMI